MLGYGPFPGCQWPPGWRTIFRIGNPNKKTTKKMPLKNPGKGPPLRIFRPQKIPIEALMPTHLDVANPAKNDWENRMGKSFKICLPRLLLNWLLIFLFRKSSNWNLDENGWPFSFTGNVNHPKIPQCFLFDHISWQLCRVRCRSEAWYPTVTCFFG